MPSCGLSDSVHMLRHMQARTQACMCMYVLNVVPQVPLCLRLVPQGGIVGNTEIVRSCGLVGGPYIPQ